MGILNRFSTIMKSNINALLDKCEDPAKMIDQALIDAKKNLAEVKKETAGVMADAKQAQRRYDECKAKVDEYTNAAMNALKAGEEADAAQLVARKQKYEADLESLASARDLTKNNADQMKQMHDKLVSDINDLEARKDTIKAKIATAKAQEHMNDVISNSKASKFSSVDFDKYDAQADKMLDAAMAKAELNDGKDEFEDLADKYGKPGNNTSVNEELEQMKAKLGL